jgi:hypothetical protein
MAPTDFESQKEALEVLRPLVAAEETRSTNLNARALGVISASSVVTAIAAFFAKDLLTGTALAQLGKSEKPALVLLIVALVLLVVTVGAGVYTLWPRTRLIMEPDGWEGWKSGTVQSGETVRQQTVKDLAGLLAGLREFNSGKVKRLKSTYFLYVGAVAAIGIDACAFFIAAL